LEFPFRFWIGNVPRCLQRFGAILDAINAREYYKSQNESAPLLKVVSLGVTTQVGRQNFLIFFF
jgi:hypothetical protein